ncbi:helix-turn-helix transcriptional regulator [bacterium]|nr:helix-turn-helix transcriptional regulator [bacterium]
MEFDEYYIKIGKHIKELREKANLTQEQLAEKAGISLDYLGKIEVNINKLGLKTVFKLAKALNVHPKEILNF